MDYITYIEPELLVIVPVLYIFGRMVKKSEVDDRYIPIILGILGIALAVTYKLAGNLPESTDQIFSLLFAGVTQGLLCAAGSVYTNNVIKQLGKGKEDESDNCEIVFKGD